MKQNKCNYEIAGQCGDELLYTLYSNGLLTIYGTGDMWDRVSPTGSPFYNDASIARVELSEGVTSIGDYAFYRCINLGIMTLPSTVTKCGTAAFFNSGVGAVKVSNSIWYKSYAFGSCNNLTDVTVEEAASLGDFIFQDCTSLNTVVIGNDAYIGEGAFQGCTSLKDLQMGDTLAGIGYIAFQGCRSLKQLTLPSYSKCGTSVFDGCTALTNVSIEDGVTTLPSGMFNGCTSLETVIIPDSVESIGDTTFPMQKEELQVGCSSYAKTWAINKGYSAEKNGYHYTEIHRWGEPQYTLSSDIDSLTATRICNADNAHIETETVHGNATTISNPTCTLEGKAEFASEAFQNEAFEAQIMIGDIPALGHDWGEAQYVWSNDNENVTASRICKRDEEHTEHETVTTSSVVTRAPTCDEDGETTYTSNVFVNSAFAVQTKIQDTDKLGHEWNEPEYTWSWGSISAVHTCKRNENHVERETAVIKDYEVILSPTGTTAGSYRVLGTPFVNSAFSVPGEGSIPALNTLKVLALPGFLNYIDAESFEGVACEAVIIPENCTYIGSKAFADSASLCYLKIPVGTEIEDDAFDGCGFVILDRTE